jgi:hypothetical protein
VTRDEAMAAILAIVPLSRPELEGFLACSDEERADLVLAYKSAGTIASPSVWSEVLAILGACDALFGLVSPLGGAVQLAYGLAHL